MSIEQGSSHRSVDRADTDHDDAAPDNNETTQAPPGGGRGWRITRWVMRVLRVSVPPQTNSGDPATNFEFPRPKPFNEAEYQAYRQRHKKSLAYQQARAKKTVRGRARIRVT